MTGYGDIQMSVRAMKAGAIDFLTKPFRDQRSSMRWHWRSIGIEKGAMTRRRWRT
jgi:ActR/RegA family two-component response regulator